MCVGVGVGGGGSVLLLTGTHRITPDPTRQKVSWRHAWRTLKNKFNVAKTSHDIKAVRLVLEIKLYLFVVV